MRFIETPIAGAWLVEPEARTDERGFFSRMWSRAEFGANGLQGEFVQSNNSLSRKRGTFRGLHYQVAPNADAKLIRCIAGRVFDVLIDLRPDSPTRHQTFGVELTPANRLLSYVPEGCAHGYLALDDNSEVIYLSTAGWVPEAERGLRWDDPLVRVQWPLQPTILSAKDRQWPDVRL